MIKIDLTKIASHKTPIFAEKTRKTAVHPDLLRGLRTLFAGEGLSAGPIPRSAAPRAESVAVRWHASD